jgi:hypothetical protein
MPLSKKEEDTLREVLSSLLKLDDSAVTRVLEVLGPNLDSLTGTGARGGGHKSLVHLTHLIQKVNKNTQVERVIKRNIPTPLTIENKNVREDPRLFKFSCGRGRKKTSKIGPVSVVGGGLDDSVCVIQKDIPTCKKPGKRTSKNCRAWEKYLW